MSDCTCLRCTEGADQGLADDLRSFAGRLRSAGADLRATADAESRALEQRAADLIAKAVEIERRHPSRPGVPA